MVPYADIYINITSPGSGEQIVGDKFDLLPAAGRRRRKALGRIVARWS